MTAQREACKSKGIFGLDSCPNHKNIPAGVSPSRKCTNETNIRLLIAKTEVENASDEGETGLALPGARPTSNKAAKGKP